MKNTDQKLITADVLFKLFSRKRFPLKYFSFAFEQIQMNVRTSAAVLMASASILKAPTVVSAHTQWFWILQESSASDQQNLVVCIILCIAVFKLKPKIYESKRIL